MTAENIQDNYGRVILSKSHYSGLRKIIGNNMSDSLKKSPQATITMRVDTTELQRAKDNFTKADKKVTFTDFFIKLVGQALIQCPAVNASLIDEKWIVKYKNVNIGVAVGTEQGLYVPVIKDIQAKTVLEISTELKEITLNLRNGNVLPEYFIGGTFTISNLGMFDIDVMTPIINTPEAAILCFGAIRKEYVIQDDNSALVRPLMWLSLTLDHAVIDGTDGAKFLLAIRNLIMNPYEYL